MAASARIDELRSKFDDNPRRYFAPLANEYRKAGDLGTAIALCRTQLRLFPTHMSGHVVLGQALFEAGEAEEAQQVFERAVELDPENLIALRHLGDIARQSGRFDAARAWYRRVLDADPYNEQIAATVAELTAAPPAPVAPAPSAPAPTPFDDDAVLSVDANPRAVAAAEPAEAQFVDLAADDLRWAPPLPSALPEPAPAQAGAEEPSEPVAEAEVSGEAEAETFEFVDDWVAAGPAAEPSAESRHEQIDLDPVVGLDLPPVVDNALEQLAPVGDAGDEPAAEPIPDGVPAPAAGPEDVWPVEPPEGLEMVRTDAFATETMAELCLDQGHEEEALAIFERLLAQRPGDAALQARVESLRARLHPVADTEPSAGDFLRGLADERPEPPVAEVPSPVDEPTTEAIAAPSAEPEPVVDERDAWAAQAWSDALRAHVAPDSALTALLDRAEPPASEDADVRIAAGPLPEPAPAAEPEQPVAPEPVVAEEAEVEPDLSFDRFFAGIEPAAPAAASPAAEPETPVTEWREQWPESPSPAAAETPAPPAAASGAPSSVDQSVDDADLAEFNAWLRGLRDS